jgi:hypothetical protein
MVEYPGFVRVGLLIGFTAGWILVARPTLAVDPLPRLEVQGGALRNSLTAERFIPRGFNCVRLDGTNGFHNLFEPGEYNPTAVETMLANLENAGFNTTRVFVDPRIGPGSVANQSDPFLSPVYMANVTDYLERSRSHGIYTVFAFSWLVHSDYYNSINTSTPPAFVGPMQNANTLYLHSGTVTAKAHWMADFAGWIQAYDPDLLSSVLTYQIENEASFAENYEPFSLSSGTVIGPDSTVYDLSVAADRLALAEAGSIYWADTTTQIVKAVDPEALVSTGLFTNLAVGRSGFGQPSSIGDPRFPLNPSTLLDTDLDFLDMHLYPVPSRTLEQDLDSINWDQVKAKADQLGKPIMLGEFGAFKFHYSDVSTAVSVLKSHLNAVEAEGFEGGLHWTYDTDEQPDLWNAQESGGVIFDMLAARIPQITADFDQDNDVDGTDFFNWQRGIGTIGATLTDGDANEDSIVDIEDLFIWQTRFGTTSAVATAAAVPEPVSLLLVLGCIFILAVSRNN